MVMGAVASPKVGSPAEQRTGERRDLSSLCSSGLCQLLFLQHLDDQSAANTKGNACQKSEDTSMRNLHSGFADAMNAVMLMALVC